MSKTQDHFQSKWNRRKTTNESTKQDQRNDLISFVIKCPFALFLHNCQAEWPLTTRAVNFSRSQRFRLLLQHRSQRRYRCCHQELRNVKQIVAFIFATSNTHTVNHSTIYRSVIPLLFSKKTQGPIVFKENVCYIRYFKIKVQNNQTVPMYLCHFTFNIHFVAVVFLFCC